LQPREEKDSMMIPDNIKKAVRDQFAGLKDNVKLKVFTQEFECDYCRETREMAEEIAGLSDKIACEVFDFEKNKKEVEEYSIDKIPAIAVVGKKDHGIRFYGIPAGYEFSSLLEAIKLVSTGNNKISDSTKKFLDTLGKEVHLKIFVSPTCPYCPISVIKAHELAYYSDKVKADMIEVTEFPHLAVKYEVQGVPRTVINEESFIEGAAPESMVIDKIREAVGASK
jgi:glutaredoxin-like protein